MTAGTTSESIILPDSLLDQIIGQEKAVDIARIAAAQRRFLFLVGEPGIGKSLLGRAFAELMPVATKFVMASLPNPNNPSSPLIVCETPEEFTKRQKSLQKELRSQSLSDAYVIWFAVVSGLILCIWISLRDQSFFYVPYMILAGILIWLWRRFSKGRSVDKQSLKILHANNDSCPFIDATGFDDGALFGDIRHDPYQSGGSETAPHLLVEAGAIHKAHRGVLYIDEIGRLSPRAQTILLSAIQDKSLPITGRQIGSSGRMVYTEPVPCDFILIAAGNSSDLAKLSPALRSRFLGYGYEVLMKSEVPDTPNSRQALARFVAQEVAKDGRIPHFSSCAIDEVIEEARRRAQRFDQLTMRLRELGGLIRVAGDLAVRASEPYVTRQRVCEALEYAMSIEEQTKRCLMAAGSQDSN